MKKLTVGGVRKRLSKARITIDLGAGSMLGDTTGLDKDAVNKALQRMIQISASK